MNWTLLPAAPGTCPECAVAHDPNQPHNRDSLFYQTKFGIEHGRGPTWADAMEHCNEEIKERWTHALESRGINVKGE
jgi:hypothetical protein